MQWGLGKSEIFLLVYLDILVPAQQSKYVCLPYLPISLRLFCYCCQFLATLKPDKSFLSSLWCLLRALLNPFPLSFFKDQPSLYGFRRSGSKATASWTERCLRMELPVNIINSNSGWFPYHSLTFGQTLPFSLILKRCQFFLCLGLYFCSTLLGGMSVKHFVCTVCINWETLWQVLF